jgi:anaerobic magnesium-protoporphyrin IX monomethyl ester cyclase
MKNSDNVDIVLIQPGSLEIYDVTFLPFAPLFLASKIREAGFGVRIFDARVQPEEELWNILKRNNVLLIGYFIITGPSIRFALKLSERIRKRYPEVKFIWGGPHPSILPEQTAEHPLVDIVGIGEGDLTLPELLSALKAGKPYDKVKGICFKKGKKIIRNPMNDFVKWDDDVHYSFDLIDINKYMFEIDGDKTTHFITSRGCPFTCTFCWNVLCNKQKWRAWSIPKIERELEPFLKAGLKRIILTEDFVGPESRVLEMARMFHRHGLKWAFENGCRVDVHKSENFFKNIKRYGCTHLSYGGESGSQEFLDKISKGITLAQVENVVRLGRKYNVGLKFSMMTGMPGESKKDALKTVQFIQNLLKINPRVSFCISLFQPYPGTKMYDECIALGYKPPKKLTDWAEFREEAASEFLDDVWWYKAVCLTNYFLFAIETDLASWKNPKGFYRFVIWFFRQGAKLRWKYKYYDNAYDYRLLQFGWNVFKKIKSWFA